MDQIGDIITQNYKEFIEDNWYWIKESINECPTMKEAEEDHDFYIYFRIHKDSLDIGISAFSDSQGLDGECDTEYWMGRAAMLVFKDTTKKQLLEFDCMDKSHYYDADYELWDVPHAIFKGWYIPITNVLGVVQKDDNWAEVSFKPRDLFKKLITERITTECLKSLEDHLGDKLLIFKRVTA